MIYTYVRRSAVRFQKGNTKVTSRRQKNIPSMEDVILSTGWNDWKGRQQVAIRAVLGSSSKDMMVYIKEVKYLWKVYRTARDLKLKRKWFRMRRESRAT